MRRAAIALILMTALTPPAFAQTADVNKRVDAIEKQLRAVQRKVFPGGESRFFEPEITQATEATAGAGSPATTQLTDLVSRVDSLEKQLTSLIGQTEQNGFRLRQLEEQMTKFRGDAEYRLNSLEGKPNTPTNSESSASAASAAAATGSGAASSATGGASLPPATATAAAKPADPGEAAYSAAYAMVVEKRYTDAAVALQDVVTKYPKHKRASYAQHWLGRTYLADGKPAMAVEAFYTNYQNNPRGDRAPDSLYWLGQALVQLKKPAEACKVYEELTDVYGGKINASLKNQVEKARSSAKCAA